MTNERQPAARGTSSGPVAYTGPLYNVWGREIAPAAGEAVSTRPARPVRPCC